MEVPSFCASDRTNSKTLPTKSPHGSHRSGWQYPKTNGFFLNQYWSSFWFYCKGANLSKKKESFPWVCEKLFVACKSPAVTQAPTAIYILLQIGEWSLSEGHLVRSVRARWHGLGAPQIGEDSPNFRNLVLPGNHIIPSLLGWRPSHAGSKHCTSI